MAPYRSSLCCEMSCKQLEVSEATYHRWRAQYGGMKADDVKRLKELEGENARLKRIVARFQSMPLIWQRASRLSWSWLIRILLSDSNTCSDTFCLSYHDPRTVAPGPSPTPTRLKRPTSVTTLPATRAVAPWALSRPAVGSG
jgi:hypothetical protein